MFRGGGLRLGLTRVARLTAVESAIADNFVVWLLGNVPRFEQSAFRELGLHEPVLSLLDSPAPEARVYAAAYARTHARDLELEELLRLANNDHQAVRVLARDLLHDRDPRKDVGLEAWGRLLGTPHAHEVAAAAIRRHFGSRELSHEWFRERLVAPQRDVFRFAEDLLGKVYPKKTLGTDFFCRLLEDRRLTRRAADFAFDGLERFPLGGLDGDLVRRLLATISTSPSS